MRLFGDALFNLLFNALATFWLALGLSLLLYRVFRLERSRFGLILLFLPFVKLVADTLRGVPSESFFWLSEHGVRQTLGTFRVGFGATALGPLVLAELWADHVGGRSPQSAGDLAARALRQKLGINAAPALAFVVAAVSCIGLGRLAVRRFETFRRVGDLARRATLLERRRAGFRSVRVLESVELAGAPFAAGVLSPFVLLPARLTAALTPAELEAVVQHELAHVVRFDAVWLSLLEVVERVFWYVPLLGGAIDRVAAELERRADDAALRAGVAAPALARALVTAAELGFERSEPRALGMTGSAATLTERLRRLLDGSSLVVPVVQPPSRLQAWLGALKVVPVAWCALAVLRAVAFGNHTP
jgi:beta-lactamase regulating signal transducer with metallopeptidase domain